MAPHDDDAATSPLSQRMEAPASGVRIRMYRQGHGDCFLLAFRQESGEPFYLLIDCGKKKGSDLECTMKEVAENIRDATGGRLHLVAITHEHEDHVSGFLSEKEVFETMEVDRLWLAWTEDPDHPLAKALRAKYKDVLLGLVRAANQLRGAAGKSDQRVQRLLEDLLSSELSADDRLLATSQPEKIKGITNKKGIQVVQQRAGEKAGTEYLSPHSAPRHLPQVTGLRVFVLGPPQNEAALKDLDPHGDEEFHLDALEQLPFLAAIGSTAAEQEGHQPFEQRHRIPLAQAAKHPQHGDFFETHYGLRKSYGAEDDRTWRRIDADWLRVAEQFALRMNTYVNNTSLVLAFELPRTKKVLLFVGDAQRGNWVSWRDAGWSADNGLESGETLSTQDLLARTVFYKVGHHGSHNATLNQGGLEDMARGPHAGEFTAMIPANEKWALENNDPPWRHPLPAIHRSLREKTQGRLFVMDRDLEPPAPQQLAAEKWQEFLGRTAANRLYFELTIED